jgi:hypothetical protein
LDKESANMNQFKAKRFHVTHKDRIKAPADQCFSLACPVEELKWIDNWQFDMIYSDSGKNENNCIFREYMSGLFVLNLPELSTYWYTTLYDTESHRFHALLLYGDRATGKFEFEVKGEGKDYSIATWKLTYTALNNSGNNLADESLRDRMFGMLSFLAQSAKHYLEAGEMLKINRM